MISLLAQGVAAKLKAQKYPATVAYGPAFATPENYPSGLIQIERDPQASDVWGPPQGSRHNPSYRGVRRVAARATFYLQESLDGALIEEHEGLCEAYVDAFLIAVSEWCSEQQRGSDPFQIGSMRYLTKEERSQEQVWPGVAYRIQFAITRAVVKQSFDGLIRPVFAIGGDGQRVIVNRTDVSYAGNTEDPPAVNCDAGADP